MKNYPTVAGENFMSASLVFFQLLSCKVGHVSVFFFQKPCTRSWSSRLVQIEYYICRLIDCMVFYAVFHCYFTFIVAARAPVLAFLEFFFAVVHTIFFLSPWLLSHITIVWTAVREE